MDDIRGGGGSRFYLDDEATQVDLKKRFIIFQSYSCPDQTSESINKQLLHLLSRGALVSLTGQTSEIVPEYPLCYPDKRHPSILINSQLAQHWTVVDNPALSLAQLIINTRSQKLSCLYSSI